MKTMEEIAASSQINEEMVAYDKLIEALQNAKAENMPIDEGLFKAVVGATSGLTVGPKIMSGVCHVLGIDERGTLGNLMTSRLVLTALAGYLGWKN